MFLAILISLALLTIAAEVILRREIVGRLSRHGRTLYYVVSLVALLLCLTTIVIGRLTDYRAEWWTVFDSVALMLFIVNAAVKILFAAEKLLTRGRERKGRFTAAFVLSLLTVVTICYGVFVEHNTLHVERLELSFGTLPEAADGLRIVEVADLHIGLKPNRYRRLEQLADSVAALRPDMILVCGDLIDSYYDELDTTTMQLLSRLKAPLGTFAVIGNHDNGMYVVDTVKLPRAENLRRLIERERAMGWQVLVDTTIFVGVGHDSIAVTGLDYPAELRRGSHGRSIENADYLALYDAVPEGVFNITAAHYPTVWDNILACDRADLTLAGHVHSMQLKIPIGRRGWSPSALVYKYWSGLYESDGRYLNVTDGAGSGVPIRVGVPPEISLITLRRSE